MDWLEVIAASALADGEHVVVDVDGDDVALFNIGGEFYAIRNQCSHAEVPLADGQLDGDEIVCPLHGARFCVKTGQVKCAPAYENVARYPVRLENGKVLIGAEPE